MTVAFLASRRTRYTADPPRTNIVAILMLIGSLATGALLTWERAVVLRLGKFVGLRDARRLHQPDGRRRAGTATADRRHGFEMRPLLIAFALTIWASLACAQESSSWHDPSIHRVQFVIVEDGVRVEVLDWDTAYVFDGFAEKLKPFPRRCSVWMRRGRPTCRPGRTHGSAPTDVDRVTRY